MIPLHTRAVCDECGEPASLDVGGFFLCERHEAILLDSVAPGASISGVKVTAGEIAPPVPSSAVTLNSVSDGALFGSLPSGEIEPAVTLAGAPSESSSCGGSINLPEPCADVSSGRYDPVNWEVERATSQSDPQDSNPVHFLPPGSANCDVALTGASPFSSSTFNGIRAVALVNVEPGPDGFDFEAAVSALEEQWLQAGVSVANISALVLIPVVT